MALSSSGPPRRHPPRGILGHIVSRSRKPPGTAPGTLVHTGPQKVETVRISCIHYDAADLRERRVERVDDLLPLGEQARVTWINVDGLHDPGVLETLGASLGFHRLVLEDVLSTGQRPKVEEYGSYFFLVLRMLSFDPATKSVTAEQVSFIVGDHYVLSFQERTGDVFDPVRERLRQGKGRIRGRGADYLLYALVDAIVDAYFGVLEEMGNEIEAIEERVIMDGSTTLMHDIHRLRSEMLIVRRAVWPLRDALAPVYRGESPLVSEETRVFMRDVHDHAVQVIDTVESLHEVLSSTMDLYLSTISNRMNEVMKVLTIIATIFIPLSFFAGLYGMNFDYMPELSIPWAYPALLVFMTALAGGMVAYFWRKGWL